MSRKLTPNVAHHDDESQRRTRTRPRASADLRRPQRRKDNGPCRMTQRRLPTPIP